MNELKINAKQKGAIAMLTVQLEAQKRGYKISIPTTEERYDLILDVNNKLYRTQIKYVDALHSASKKKPQNISVELRIDALRTGGSHKQRKVYSKSEIDLMLIYVPKVNAVLAYHPEFFHNKRSIRINISNHQTKMYYKKHLW